MWNPTQRNSRERGGERRLPDAATGARGHLLVDQLLGEAEVRELDVTLPVQQYILRLEVPVDNLLGVQVLNGADDLRGVEEPRAAGEAAPVAQVAEELAAWHELHQHVEEALVVARPEPAGQQRGSESGSAVPHACQPKTPATVWGRTDVKDVVSESGSAVPHARMSARDTCYGVGMNGRYTRRLRTREDMHAEERMLKYTGGQVLKSARDRS